MKRITKILFFALMLLNSIIYSQTGWVMQTSPAAQELHDVFFVNQNTGWAVGRFNAGGMIIKTTNGGSNWFTQFNAANELLSSHFINDNTGWACGIGGLLLKTSNAGVNWSSAIVGGSGISLTSVYISNIGVGYIGASNGKAYFTPNFGNTWQEQSVTNNNPVRDIMQINIFGYCIGSFVPDNKVYGALSGINQAWGSLFIIPEVEPRDLWITEDIGNIFFIVGDGTKLGRGLGGNWSIITMPAANLYCVQFTDNQTGYVCGENGAVLKSINSGFNWVFQQSNTTNRLRDLHFIDALTGWAVGDNGAIIKTTTGGETAPRAPINLTAFGVSSSQINLNWIDSSNNELRFKIERSTNAGANWLLIDSVAANVVSYNNTGLTPNTIYHYRIYAVNAAGNSPFSNTAFDTTFAVTGISQENGEIPKEYMLFSNYPNPFNPATSIKFAIPERSFVKITIYDLLGREVERLFQENLDAGNYKLNWIASAYSSGVYFYRIEAGEFSDIKKMMLVK